jgi:hypothetical protein
VAIPFVVASGPVEESSPEGLEQAQGEARQRCGEAVAEILCDMLINTVTTSEDKPALGGR